MTGPARTGRGQWGRMNDWWLRQGPGMRLVLRWILITVLTVLAFRSSLRDLLHTTAAGGLVGFVWLLLPAVALAAIGIDLRRRAEPPINDRQTDIIVGVMALVLAVVVQGILVPRYAEFFHLLRLDLLAMWLFVVGANIVLFGVRPVSRYLPVWLLLALAFLLPYQTLVIVFGGGRFAAGLAALVVASAATAISVGRTRTRAVLGAAATFAVGLLVLALLGDVPLLAYQVVPSGIGMGLVCAAFLLYSRRGQPLATLVHHIEPPVAKQVWAGIPLVLAAALALALIPLPAQRSATVINREAPGELAAGQGLVAPPGWSILQTTESSVQGFYGDGAELVRQKMIADVGGPRFDKLSAPRILMVDSIVSDQPFSFDAYPGHIFYDTSGTRLSSPRDVDLGNGVAGVMVSAIDDRLLVTWDVLRFARGSDEEDQLVQIFAVDNHLLDAPFPEAGHGVPSTLRMMFTVLFRGNAAAAQRSPLFKDAELLTEFGRALVAAQLEPQGSRS